jgi:hypothetical protein
MNLRVDPVCPATPNVPRPRPERGAGRLRAEWSCYRAQVSWLRTWSQGSAPTAPDRAPAARRDGAWSRQIWAAVVEQHDALIRRLGDWPALDVWHTDLVVAVQAAERQLAALLADRLTAERAGADRHGQTALLAEEVRRLSRTLGALRTLARSVCADETSPPQY